MLTEYDVFLLCKRLFKNRKEIFGASFIAYDLLHRSVDRQIIQNLTFGIIIGDLI